MTLTPNQFMRYGTLNVKKTPHIGNQKVYKFCKKYKN